MGKSQQLKMSVYPDLPTIWHGGFVSVEIVAASCNVLCDERIGEQLCQALPSGRIEGQSAATAQVGILFTMCIEVG